MSVYHESSRVHMYQPQLHIQISSGSRSEATWLAFLKTSRRSACEARNAYRCQAESTHPVVDRLGSFFTNCTLAPWNYWNTSKRDLASCATVHVCNVCVAQVGEEKHKGRFGACDYYGLTNELFTDRFTWWISDLWSPATNFVVRNLPAFSLPEEFSSSLAA